MIDRNFVDLIIHSSSLPNDTFSIDWTQQQVYKTFITDVQHDNDVK